MASQQARAVILGGARTPMTEWVGGKTGAGKPGGRLKDVSANDLGALAARAAMERTAVQPADVQHVIMGNALQTSSDALYGARHVALKAGLPEYPQIPGRPFVPSLSIIDVLMFNDRATARAMLDAADLS